MKKDITENMIPYRQLEDYGISREMFLDLPGKAIERILKGRLSPLLNVMMPDGRRVPYKITLVKEQVNGGKDGETREELNFRFFGRKPEMDMEMVRKHRLTEAETDILKDGRVLLKDGLYFQLDRDTNALLVKKEEKDRIDGKIKEIASSLEDIQLGDRQRDQIRNGQPVTVSKGDTEVTIGVDLDTISGIRVIKGDLDDWRQRKMVEWDRLTPGATGYWQTAENGWEYTKEQEKYRTQTEQERNTGRHSSGRTRG